MRYRAFISYSHADAAWASWLHRKLEGYRLPRRMHGRGGQVLPEQLTPIFRDREELASAGELGPQIQAALADSEALIVLCSPEAARSRWVDAEVLSFKRGGRGAQVYALIVDGEPNSGDERECFPPSLRFELDADGSLSTRPSEPIAADVRPGKDGKSLALLKLISGLLGVNLDSLRQREAKRRHQRMAAVAALALVVMLLTSWLAVQAELARRDAERRQKQAEALVDFMLGDLNDKLAEVARLDILEGVHDHAMDYFRSLPESDVTDEALAQRARALTRIGNVRLEQGHLDKAKDSYLAAERLSARLAQAAPRGLDRQLQHADVLAYLGMLAWYQGDLDQARRRFDASRGVLLRAQAFAPDDATLLYQLSTLDNNAGHVLESRGNIEAATMHYRSMLAASRKLVAQQPGRSEWQTQLGLAHNNLAKMALLRGDMAAAVAGYRADVAVEAALAARDSRNNAQLELLLISRSALGRTLAQAGALDEGAATLQLAFDAAQRLSALEPNSALFAEDVALYSTQLARLRRLQGDAVAAAALTARSLSVIDSLLAKDANNPGWRRERAEALLEKARQPLPAASPTSARAILAEALAILEPLLAQHPDDRNVLLATVAARVQLSVLEPPAQAQELLRRALADCVKQTSGQRDPRLRALQAESLLRLGEHVRAEALAGELWQDGYRDAGFAALLREHAITLPAAPAAKLASRASP